VSNVRGSITVLTFSDAREHAHGCEAAVGEHNPSV
jgi:hypothetical protein